MRREYDAAMPRVVRSRLRGGAAVAFLGLCVASLAGCSASTSSSAPATSTTNPGCAQVAHANLAYAKAIEQTTATAATLGQASATMRSALESAKPSLPPHAAKQATYAAAELTTIEQHLRGSSQSSFAADLLAFHTTLKNLRSICEAQH